METRNSNWNFGSWFGSQFGLTVWMLVFSMVLVATDIASAAVAFVAFVAANAVGVHLWRQREQRDHLSSLMTLVFVAGVASAVTFVTVSVRDAWPKGSLAGLMSLPANGSSGATYLWLLVYPVVGLVMYLALKKRGRSVIS